MPGTYGVCAGVAPDDVREGLEGVYVQGAENLLVEKAGRDE